MLIGVDWGGTNIEIVAMTPDGVEHLRSRQATPRADYDGCLRVIADLVDRAEAEVGPIDRVGAGIPGSIDPRTGLGKGASSTWIMGKPIGRGLSVVVDTLDPDVLVMGGGMSNVGELYEQLPDAIARYTISTVFITPIVRTRHGDSSGVRGAAWLWAED